MTHNRPEFPIHKTRHEATVQRFEEAWRKGAAPNLRSFWKDCEPLALLVELIHIDMKYRLGQKQKVRIESYLKLFPSLASEDELLMSLLVTERSARSNAGGQVGLDEYRRRFPRLAPRLQEADNSTADYVPTPTAADSGMDPFLARLLAEKKRLGRYRLDKLLGAGAMGGVFQGWDDKLQRSVAVKVPQTDTMSRDASARQRFLTEARAAAHLRHPNICPVYDVGDDEGVPYITMAFISGTTLSQRLGSGAPIPIAKACEWAAKIAGALHTAHAACIIHRDIKPANIMLDAADEPILMDFGLARRQAPDVSQRTSPGVAIGSPAYMAPEQVEGNVDLMGPATDIYGLGVVLFQMLAGRTPFQGHVSKLFADILGRSPPSLVELCPAVPAPLADICMKAIAKRPANRFATALEFAAALTPFFPPPSRVDPAATVAAAKTSASAKVERADHEASGGPKPQTEPGPKGRRLARTVGACFVFLGVVAGAVFYWSMSDGKWVKDQASATVQNGESTPANRSPAPETFPERLSERDIAKWVLEMDGSVALSINGQETSFTDAALLPAGEFPLQRIHLHGNGNVNDANVGKIRGAQRLRWLSLEFTAVGDAGLTFISELTHLEHIGLEHSKATGKTIQRMKPLIRLGSLLLNGLSIGDRAFESLAGCKDLKILGVNSAGLTDASLPVIAKLANLSYLTIAGNSLTPKNLQHLVPLQNLTLIELDGQNIAASEMAVLAKLRKLQHVRIINLTLHDETLTPLTALSDLEILGLPQARFDKQAIVPFQRLTKLKQLFLSDSNVRGGDLERIAQLPGLIWLVLRSTDIADKDLAPLETMKTLEWIDLIGTKVTSIGATKLRSSIPRCKIEWTGGVIEGDKK